MENLGIQPVNLLAQVFNFVILLIVLKKFLYKPILKMLDERQKKVAQGLEYAEKTKVEMEKYEKRREELLAIAKEEAKEVVSNARKEAKKMIVEMTNNAQQEAKEIVEKARHDASRQYETGVRELEREAVTIASRMVERLFKDELTAKEQKDIISRRLKAL